MALVFASLLALVLVGLEKNWWLKPRAAQAAAAPCPPTPAPVEDLRRVLRLEGELAELRAREQDMQAQLEAVQGDAVRLRGEDDGAEVEAQARMQGLRRELAAARAGQGVASVLATGTTMELEDLRRQLGYWKGLCGGGCHGRQGVLLSPPAGSLTATSARVR